MLAPQSREPYQDRERERFFDDLYASERSAAISETSAGTAASAEILGLEQVAAAGAAAAVVAAVVAAAAVGLLLRQ